MEGGASRCEGGVPTSTRQAQYEVTLLQNFFKSLLNTKDCGVSPGSALAVSSG
jgi:hypothetical protein